MCLSVIVPFFWWRSLLVKHETVCPFGCHVAITTSIVIASICMGVIPFTMTGVLASAC